MNIRHDSNATCGTCRYMKCGNAEDNFRFACINIHVASTYITNYTPACEYYEAGTKKEDQND